MRSQFSSATSENGSHLFSALFDDMLQLKIVQTQSFYYRDLWLLRTEVRINLWHLYIYAQQGAGSFNNSTQVLRNGMRQIIEINMANLVFPESDRTLHFLLDKPDSKPGYFVASWWRHHCVIPPKLLLTNRFYFQQNSGTHAPVGKRKGGSLSARSPAPIADSFHVATIARKHSVLNLREINRNNTHSALASVLTYYGWVSLIC
jgi:hypothetical protein